MASNKLIILAIDGGGIRGIIPAYILNQLEDNLGKGCYQLFDIIGGTSTGAILAAGLTTPNPSDPNHFPYPAQALLNIYLKNGAQIFVKQGNNPLDLKASYVANDNGKGIEPFLQNSLGATASLAYAASVTGQLAGCKVKQAFTTGCIVNSSGGVVTNPVVGQDEGAYLFNWYDAVNNGLADDYYVWEAARCSSAAPSYFPVAQVGGGSNGRSNANAKWVVDGGVMSNNPAMWGLAEAFRTGLAQNLSDIVLVSIGTGFYPGGGGVGITNNAGTLVPADGNWSLGPWMGPDMYDLQGQKNEGALVNIILDAVQNVAAQQLQGMMNAGLTYYRLEPSIPYSLSQMDNISPANITALLNAAKSYIAVGGAGYAVYTDVLNAVM